MILNTGSRTDIPAFYSEWFYKRIQEGNVCVRHPFDPKRVLRYKLDPKVVDVLCFCTKDPRPMLDKLMELNAFRQFWFITITPYGKDIEPYVPNKLEVIESVKQLASFLGKHSIALRYDPIFINEKYTVEYHLRAFEKIISSLKDSISFCVISFIDLYKKTKKNFPQVKEVPIETQCFLAEKFNVMAKKYGISIRSCCENEMLANYGIETSGCMNQSVLEHALGMNLEIPKSKKSPRSKCNCLLGSDIGSYNSCLHGCIYCYANHDRRLVEYNVRRHDVSSPLLIGNIEEGDHIVDMKQESFLAKQLSLF